MSSAVVSLYELINHCMLCEDRLQPYKMNSKQIVQVFAWLDHRRRGHVDVSDFYTKFPELSESELFFVYKYLDISRKGRIVLEDLCQLLSVKHHQDTLEYQNDPVKSFSSLIRVLKATFHLIEEQKKKLALTTTAVESVFNLATLNKKQQIDLTDLIVVFKENNLEINEKMTFHLKTKIFTKTFLTSNEFTQIFSQFIWDWASGVSTDNGNGKSQSHNQQYRSYQDKPSSILNQDKLNSNIDSILSKYRNPQNLESFLTIPKRQQYQSSFDVNKFISSQIPSRFQSNLEQFRSSGIEQRYNSQDSDSYTKHTQVSTNKIDQLLNSASVFNQGQKQVNLRREELRKGSIERQRIIDEVMNRKKYQVNGKSGMLYPQNLKIETNQEYIEPRLASSNYQPWRPSTPNSRTLYEYKQPSFQSAFMGRLNEQQPYPERQLPSRPTSAAKTSSSFFDKSNYGKIFSTTDHSSLKPDLQQFYRKGCQTPKSNHQEKQNIIRKAEEEASRKIEQIQRRARLKVMEKRSTTGIYNKWLK